MQYIILSHDMKQADYYYKRTRAILNPIVDSVDPFRFALAIGDTSIRFASEVDYYTKLQPGYRDATVMRDTMFEEKLFEYMKNVKNIKEIVKNERTVSNS